MTTGREVSQGEGVFRFAGAALVAATTNIVLGGASIMAADRFPDGAVRTTLQFGIVVSFAVGLLLLDRGYRKRTAAITPLYITGVLCYLLVLSFVFFRLLLTAAAARGQLNL